MPTPQPRRVTSSPSLRVHLLGAPTWQLVGRDAVALIAKDAALLAKLALDGPQPRAVLCDLLWPDSTPSQAAANLRQRAMRLSKQAGVPFVELGESIRLHPALAVDVLRLDALPDDALPDSAGLLNGVDLGNHDSLDRWLCKARTSVAERCAQCLADRAEALERDGRLHEAVALGRGIVAWLPLSEQAGRRLMRLHYLRGDRAAALEAYWQLASNLREELGTRPSAETMALLQTIEAAEQAPSMPQRPVPVSLMRPPVVIGRHEPWSAMAQAWQRPQPFLLVGDAGIGKSRLLEEFIRNQDGLVEERARPGDQQSTHAVLGRVLWQVNQRWAALQGCVHRGELARLHAGFGERPEAPATAAAVRHAVEQWLFAAMGAGLRAIVIDDLHNADLASLEDLRWLAASPLLAPLQLGLASRPWTADSVGAVVNAWLADSHRPVRIDLKPLSRSELTTLLTSLALPVLLNETIADHLYRHAGGQPLYTLATLQHAVASGKSWQEPQALAPPESVQALLDARVRALPATTAQLLPVAAVGGADLSVDRAARLLGTTPLSLSEAWAGLEAHDVLRGEAFSHDLVHDAALRSVPLGLRQLLHRQWAALLRDEGSAQPARVAVHWEQGLRWSDAGHAWHAAAVSARLAGRLEEQAALFDRAARCHAQAGDVGARFDAMLARLDGVHLRQGAAEVLNALPEVEALADTTLRHLQCRIARTEALLDLGRADEAEAESRRALDHVQRHPEWAPDVHAQLAIALAQSNRPGEALASATQAVDSARTNASASRLLKATNALMFVHWSAGRLMDAVQAQREELACAEALADRASAAASEGSLAALLASAGDVPEAHAHALRARERQREVGLAENSTQVILNHTVLGAAAAALGRFDDALQSLQQAVDLAGPDAAPGVYAKACLSLARVWLTLGRADRVFELAAAVPADVAPGLLMQALWLMARAAEQEGRPAQKHWSRFTQLDARHGELPMVLAVVFEVSYIGEAPRVIERLVNAREACEALGLHGLARALAWRELVRWLELPGPQATNAAKSLADSLLPHANTGLSAKCYPPDTWVSLAQAYERAGHAQRQIECLVAGSRWLTKALPCLAPEHRAAFSNCNAANRLLLTVADSP